MGDIHAKVRHIDERAPNSAMTGRNFVPEVPSYPDTFGPSKHEVACASAVGL